VCGYPLVKQNAVPPPGWRRHGARGLCEPDYEAARHAGRVIDYQRSYRSRDEVLDEWARWRPEGWTRAHTAAWLGMSLAAFEQVLWRARRIGDSRAVLGKRGIDEARTVVEMEAS